MNRNQPILTICTRTHFLGRAEQHSHLAASYLCKQFFFLCIGVGFVDKTHLFRRDSTLYKFLPHIIVDISKLVGQHFKDIFADFLHFYYLFISGCR